MDSYPVQLVNGKVKSIQLVYGMQRLPCLLVNLFLKQMESAFQRLTNPGALEEFDALPWKRCKPLASLKIAIRCGYGVDR